MPRLDTELSVQAQSAIAIVRAGEISRISGDGVVRAEWSGVRIEALYELAFLRIFAAWEAFLEAVLCRSLCGYSSTAGGQEQLVAGAYFRKLSDAEAAILHGQQYKLWSNPTTVEARCRGFIRSGPGCPCIQADIISSNIALLNSLASARHRIVHDQLDAKRKFDTAALAIAGRTYPASRPGKFLRDMDTSSAPSRNWLNVASNRLISLASQMV